MKSRFLQACNDHLKSEQWHQMMAMTSVQKCLAILQLRYFSLVRNGGLADQHNNHYSHYANVATKRCSSMKL